MGYNTSILFAKQLSQEQLMDIIPDVFDITSEIVDFETASSYTLSPNFAMCAVKDWTIIWDAGGKLNLDQSFVKKFAVSKAISFGLNSTKDRYNLIFAQEKELVQAITFLAGKKMLDKGQGLLQKTEDLDEDKIWQLIEKTTGITLAILESLEYKLVVLD